MRTMKTLAIAAFAASALALAGCGGGGSSSSGEPPAPPAPKMVSLPANIPAGMAPSGTHEIAAGETATSNGVTFACAAGGEACMVMVAADGTTATYTGGTVTASLSQAAQTAIDNAKKVSDADKKAMDDAAKERSATAKALKAAIEIAKVAGDGTTAAVITPTSIPVLDADGEAGTNEATEVDTDPITLKKGDTVGSLGNWKGTDYAGMEASTGAAAKNTGMVRVYTNEAASKGVSFTSEAGGDIHGLSLNTGTTADDDYTVATGAANSNIKSDSFPTTGQRTYTGDDTKFDGTFMGAAGTFECTGATDCTATIDADGAITLAGDAWNFTPKAGALLQQRDASYLRFGWWIRKDKDGPTHAGVFYGSGGATALTPLAASAINNANLIGKATYSGAAAGKFAISDPLRPGDDNAGHFTADAELTADFKGAGGDASTLMGTIDAFRLNDGSADPGWSIALREADFGTGDAFSGNTVWSIGDAKAAASGSWEAQMFNDKPADGTNVPQSTVGSFRSDFGSTHSMVGAFGAEKQE